MEENNQSNQYNQDIFPTISKICSHLKIYVTNSKAFLIQQGPKQRLKIQIRQAKNLKGTRIIQEHYDKLIASGSINTANIYQTLSYQKPNNSHRFNHPQITAKILQKNLKFECQNVIIKTHYSFQCDKSSTCQMQKAITLNALNYFKMQGKFSSYTDELNLKIIGNPDNHLSSFQLNNIILANTRLKSLSLDLVTQLSEVSCQEFAKRIGKLSKLEYLQLNISHNKEYKAFLETFGDYLTNFTRLEYLNLNLESTGVEKLTNFNNKILQVTTLKSLILNLNINRIRLEQIDELLTSLQYLEILESIRIDYCRQGLEQNKIKNVQDPIKLIFPNLRKIQFQCGPLIPTQQILWSFSNCTRLEELIFSVQDGAKLIDQISHIFLECKELTFIELNFSNSNNTTINNNKHFENLACNLSTLPKLKELKIILSNSDTNNECFISLWNGLLSSKSLKKLELLNNQNQLTQIGCQYHSISNLTDLNLDFSKNSLGDRLSISQFGKCLERLKFLEDLEINLNQSKISNEEFKNFGLNLSFCNPKMKSLKLHCAHNFLKKESGQSFGEALQNLQNLVTLQIDFSENTLDVEGTLAIGLGIASCNKLQNVNINLNGNTMQDQSPIEFGKSLSKCSSLQFLKFDCEYCSIKTKGAAYLIYYISQCKIMKCLRINFKSNFITNNGVDNMVQQLESCSKLNEIELVLKDNKIEICKKLGWVEKLNLVC